MSAFGRSRAEAAGRRELGHAPGPVRKNSWLKAFVSDLSPPSLADGSEGHYGNQAPLGGADGAEPFQHTWA